MTTTIRRRADQVVSISRISAASKVKRESFLKQQFWQFSHSPNRFTLASRVESFLVNCHFCKRALRHDKLSVDTGRTHVRAHARIFNFEFARMRVLSPRIFLTRKLTRKKRSHISHSNQTVRLSKFTSQTEECCQALTEMYLASCRLSLFLPLSLLKSFPSQNMFPPSSEEFSFKTHECSYHTTVVVPREAVTRSISSPSRDESTPGILTNSRRDEVSLSVSFGSTALVQSRSLVEETENKDAKAEPKQTQ